MRNCGLVDKHALIGYEEFPALVQLRLVRLLVRYPNNPNPPNRNGTMAKGGLMRRESVLQKTPCYELAFILRRVNRICLWPPKREERSSVVTGAGGMRRSDWPERV